MELVDAVREGDGKRVLIWWKYALVFFHATRHSNYAMEALTLLVQHKWLIPPRQRMQLQYGRFINVRGKPGGNVSCDLYNEHLNRLAKTCIQHLGANKVDKCIDRIGKCIGPLDQILLQFDDEHDIGGRSGHHPTSITVKDRDEIIKELCTTKVLEQVPDRIPRTKFSSFRSNIMKRVDKVELIQWMSEKIPIIRNRTNS